MDNINLPKVILAWNTPDFNTTPIESYVVTHDNTVVGTTNNTFYEIDLSRDDKSVAFSVYVLDNLLPKNGGEEFCHIQDTLERRYGEFFSYLDLLELILLCTTLLWLMMIPHMCCISKYSLVPYHL